MESLRQVFPAPESPTGPPTESDWTAAEQSLEIVFPADYRELLNVYGVGSFRLPGDMVVVLGPTAVAEEAGPDGLYPDQLESWFEEMEPDEVPYSIFPELSGLLGFGGNDNGYSFFWHTNGPSDGWTIVAATEDGHFEEFDMNLTDFLVKMSRGQLETSHLNQALNRGADQPLQFAPRAS